MAFYVDVLGFRLCDHIEKPFRAYFFHVNPRHHSPALIETSNSGIMLECGWGGREIDPAS